MKKMILAQLKLYCRLHLPIKSRTGLCHCKFISNKKSKTIEHKIGDTIWFINCPFCVLSEPCKDESIEGSKAYIRPAHKKYTGKGYLQWLIEH